MWTIEKLKKYFVSEGIPDHYFGFYEDKDDAFCIDQSGNEWIVFYSEKGTRKELGWGKSESQALDILRLFVIEEYKLM